MIFVTVGSREYPFDRLLRALTELQLDEPLVVQHGPSKHLPTRATCADFLSYSDIAEHMRRSRLVVTHAGVGSVLTALNVGKRPIVVPRLRRFGEAIDDHQLPLAERLEQSGVATVLRDVSELRALLQEPTAEPVLDARRRTGLVTDLGLYLTSILGSAGRAGSARAGAIGLAGDELR